jgi:uncharacterized cupin superfamily protein
MMSLPKAALPVVRSKALEWTPESSPSGIVAFQRKKLGAAAGSEKLGCSLMELAPGKRSWPRHAHFTNEEALYILKGTGKITLGDKEIAVAAGDYVALLPGQENVHQTINDAEEPLVYLCFSTMVEPDLTLYPDTSKVGVFAGAAPGGPEKQGTFKGFFRLNEALDYWEDE